MADALTDSDIEYCLLALYRRGGSYKETEEYLKTTYLGDLAPDKTRLKRWRTGIHRDKYLALAAANAEDLEKEIVVRLRELATQAGLLQVEGMDHLLTRIKSGDVTPTMIKELAVISGVSIDKLLVLSGRPDKIVAVQNPDDILKRLVDAGFADVVDGTTVEDAELALTDGTPEDLRTERSRTVEPQDGSPDSGPTSASRSRREAPGSPS